MILIDYSQIAISNIAVQLAMSKDKMTLSIPIVRHMILNSIKGYVHKFKHEYPGDIVIAVDGPSPWRRDIFPHYKAKRREGRDESKTDWESVFGLLHTIKEEIRDNFPYKVMHQPNCEADDVIAKLALETQEFGKHEPVMIISADHDFIQLHKYDNIKQYSPMLKKFVKDKNPRLYSMTHIFLSLIHISEPTRLLSIGYGGVWV